MYTIWVEKNVSGKKRVRREKTTNLRNNQGIISINYILKFNNNNNNF